MTVHRSMKTPAAHPHDTEPLADQVAGLLNEGDPTPHAPPALSPDDEFADLASQIETLLGTPPPNTPPPSPAAEPAEPIARDLSAQVASLLDAGPQAPNSIGAIDKDLANLTETLLADPNAATPSPSPPPPPPRPAITPHAEPSPAPLTAQPSPPLQTPHDVLAAPATGGSTGTASPRPGPSLRALATRLLTPVGIVLGRPLASQPRSIRDSAGWLALWTLSCGVFVWIYALFLHSPRLPRTPADAPAITRSDGGRADDRHADASPPTDASPRKAAAGGH
jgi:hypothetical protein